MPKKERLLILSIDRDNDIGVKAGVEGPIVGKEKAIKTAVKLSIKDPEESDSNAIFGAVKLHDELKDKYDAEIAILTGHRNRGIEADREIAGQLNKVLAKKPSDFVIFVSDGKDDEHVIPIIQSKIPILSVKRIVIKQAERLESGYYKIKDFLKESMENAKFARLVFGLPAVALLLYALFDMAGWRLIVGIMGAYLFVKGFKLENYVYGFVEEMQSSFSKRKFAFFIYIVSFAVMGLALYRGYNSILEFYSVGLFESIAAFVVASVYFFWIAGTIAWLGRNISLKKRSGTRIASIPLFGLAVSLVLYNASEIVLSPEISSFNFIISIAIGFVIAFIALSMEAMD